MRGIELLGADVVASDNTSVSVYCFSFKLAVMEGDTLGVAFFCLAFQ